MATLRLTNPDATPHTISLECNSESIPLLVRWYAAYHAGDAYRVHVDGRHVPHGPNGEIAPSEAE